MPVENVLQMDAFVVRSSVSCAYHTEDSVLTLVRLPGKLRSSQGERTGLCEGVHIQIAFDCAFGADYLIPESQKGCSEDFGGCSPLQMPGSTAASGQY